MPWTLPPGPAFDARAIVPEDGGVWRYRKQIRLPEACVRPTLGEGAGAWVHLPDGPTLALAHIEPTLSFKDRGIVTMLAWALAAGVATPLIEDSSGNAGGSFAAYAAAIGVRCRIYLPASAPAGKKAALAAFGAEVVEVEGPRPRATEAAQADSEGTYVSHAWNPFFIEGTKTLAFQWWERYPHRIPRRVFVPAGQGSLILGLRYGFGELQAAYPDLRLPRLFAVQHRTAAPLWSAVEMPGAPPAVAAEDEPSLADGIAIADPVRRDALVTAIKDSRGGVVVVGNREVREAQTLLCGHGVWAEPTGATAYAGYRQLGGTTEDVVVVTGHGIKAAR
jgi:threonine synthase